LTKKKKNAADRRAYRFSTRTRTDENLIRRFTAARDTPRAHTSLIKVTVTLQLTANRACKAW